MAHYPPVDDPGVAAPENPPKPAVEVTPLAVADTEDAVIEPFDTLVPWTVTVSPGFSPLSDELALRVTVADGLKVTFTRAPLDVVTYNVVPMMSVTVPDVPDELAAKGKPVAAVPPDRDALARENAPANPLRLAELPWLFWRADPPQMPLATRSSPSRIAVGVRRWIPRLAVCVGHASSPTSPAMSAGSSSPNRGSTIVPVIGPAGAESMVVGSWLVIEQFLYS
jgi:hypothetical protein